MSYSWTSAIFNILAATFLIGALIPAYLDAKKFRKTFFIEENFFKFFFFGAASMFINSIAMLYKSVSDNLLELIIMFSFFILSNSVSMFVNFYSWNMKRQNAAAAKNLGISEQEYWETHIAPTLESN